MLWTSYRCAWNWPHDMGSSASFVPGKQKLHSKHAQMASLSHLLALLSGSIRQQLQWHGGVLYQNSAFLAQKRWSMKSIGCACRK